MRFTIKEALEGLRPGTSTAKAPNEATNGVG